MVQRVATVAFEGIEARAVDVQVQVAPGLPAFNLLSSINFLIYYFLFLNKIKYLGKNDRTLSSSACVFLRSNVDVGAAQGR